jgi:hypothetical protein
MMRVMLYEAAQSMLHSKKWSWLACHRWSSAMCTRPSGYQHPTTSSLTAHATTARHRLFSTARPESKEARRVTSGGFRMTLTGRRAAGGVTVGHGDTVDRMLDNALLHQHKLIAPRANINGEHRVH